MCEPTSMSQQTKQTSALGRCSSRRECNLKIRDLSELWALVPGLVSDLQAVSHELHRDAASWKRRGCKRRFTLYSWYVLFPTGERADVGRISFALNFCTRARRCNCMERTRKWRSCFPRSSPAHFWAAKPQILPPHL